MSEYNFSQIQNMQKQAQQRVNQMNERVKRVINQNPQPEPETEQIPKQTKGGFLQGLNLHSLIGDDTDQTLIVIVLALILSDGNYDEILILALLYLLI